MAHRHELTITERVGLIVYLFAVGRTLTTSDIASVSGITANGAWKLVNKLSRVIPLIEYEGQWSLMPEALPRRK